MIRKNLKYLKIILIVLMFTTVTIEVNAQVGIGTTSPNSSAIVDIDVSSLVSKKGFLPPRMTTAEKDALGTTIGMSEKGMLVFDTDLVAFYYWDGTKWLLIRIDSVITDSDSLGNIYLTTTTSTNNVDASGVKIQGTTSSVNLLNFTTGGVNNRLVYSGATTRLFTIICSLSFEGELNDDDVFSFYIVKGPTLTTIESTRVYNYIKSDEAVNSLSISGTVSLATGEWIEVWVDADGDGGDLKARSLNLLIE